MRKRYYRCAQDGAELAQRKRTWESALPLFFCAGSVGVSRKKNRPTNQHVVDSAQQPQNRSSYIPLPGSYVHSQAAVRRWYQVPTAVYTGRCSVRSCCPHFYSSIDNIYHSHLGGSLGRRCSRREATGERRWRLNDKTAYGCRQAEHQHCANVAHHAVSGGCLKQPKACSKQADS